MTVGTSAPSATRVLRILAHRRRRKPADVLYRLYLVAFFTFPSAQVAIHAEGVATTSPEALALQRGLLSWAPVVLAGVLVGVARFSAWAGLVVPEAGEVAWVLTAPLPRAQLLRPRLRRALLSAMFAGVLLAYLPAWFVIASLEVAAGPVLGAAALAGLTIGALAAAVSWWVQGAEARARWALRIGPWLLAAGVLLGPAAAAWPQLRAVVAWSGPWGWVALPFVGSIGAEPVPGAGTAAALAAGAAAVGAAWVLWRADAVPLAEFVRRAAPFAGVRSALFIGDARFAALVRRQAVRQLMGVPRRRLPHPQRPALVVPWMDALGLLRAPRWLWTCLLVGLVTALAGRAGSVSGLPGVVPVGLGLVGAMVAASQAIDGLRAEHNALVGTRYLPWPAPRILLLHLVTPTIALSLGVVVAGASAFAIGAPGRIVGLAAAGAVLAVPPLVTTAALSATAPDIDPSLLLSGGQTGATMTLLQVAVGPLVALPVVALPAVVVLAAVGEGGNAVVALSLAAGWSATATAGVVSWLRRRLQKAV